MAWSSPATAVAGTVATAAFWNTNSRDNLNALLTYSAEVLTSQTTTSTSYTDLATAGPAVTLTTGTKALVIVQSNQSSTAGSALMAFAVSGASTIAASDDYHAQNASTNALSACALISLTGLTAGSNTFTAKYRVSAGTGTYKNRRIAVIPIYT